MTSSQRLTLAHEKRRYLRPDGFNFKTSESESVNENQKASQSANIMTIRTDTPTVTKPESHAQKKQRQTASPACVTATHNTEQKQYFTNARTKE